MSVTTAINAKNSTDNTELISYGNKVLAVTEKLLFALITPTNTQSTSRIAVSNMGTKPALYVLNAYIEVTLRAFRFYMLYTIMYNYAYSILKLLYKCLYFIFIYICYTPLFLYESHSMYVYKRYMSFICYIRYIQYVYPTLKLVFIRLCLYTLYKFITLYKCI